MANYRHSHHPAKDDRPSDHKVCHREYENISFKKIMRCTLSHLKLVLSTHGGKYAAKDMLARTYLHNEPKARSIVIIYEPQDPSVVQRSQICIPSGAKSSIFSGISGNRIL